MNRLVGTACLGVVLMYLGASAQVIEFENNGMQYQALTRSGVTVMYAPMATRLKEYTIIQVAVSNGSRGPYVIRPEDFSYVHSDGTVLHGASARTVVNTLAEKGSGSDVIKLITTYEAAVYGNPHFKSTNGYEERRRAALAMTSNKLRAAATASALALVQSKLAPGESTDGVVFFSTVNKPLGPGRVVVKTNTDVFEFKPEQ